MMDYIFNNKEVFICSVIILLAIIQTFRRIIMYDNVGRVLVPVYSTVSTVLTIIMLLCFYDKINSAFISILEHFDRVDLIKNTYVHVTLIALTFCIIKILFQMIFQMIIDAASVHAFNDIKRNKLKGLMYSIVIGAARGCVLIILVYGLIALFNISFNDSKSLDFLDDFKLYNVVENSLNKNDIKSITNGLKEKTKEAGVQANDYNKNTVYYNGITIDEGVKSSNEIKSKADEITKHVTTDREKAKKLYIWIGTNIKYDNEKAEKVINDDDNIKSGAIITYKTKKGICFDYACLYSAMAKEVGLKNRIVVGEAYNGREYISHAWNQVFLQDENRWVNVDSTFYGGGNYFDNDNFTIDHINGSVIGEF